MTDEPITAEVVPDDTPGAPNKKISQEVEDEIARLRLAGVPVRQIAKETGVSTGTCTNAFRRWLRNNAAQMLGDQKQIATEVVMRLWQNANDARMQYVLAEKPRDKSSLLNNERQAIMDLAKLCGIDVTRIKVDGPNAGPELDSAIQSVIDKLEAKAIEAKASDG